jgi:predicted RNase H-like HicB family nuclease
MDDDPLAREEGVGVSSKTAGRVETRGESMRTFTAVVERDTDTGLFVGYVPGFSGAHSQGATLDELNQNLSEVVAMLLEDGEPELDAEFVGIQTISA